MTEKELRKKERRKIKRDERRSRKKAETNIWRNTTWKRLDEMSNNEKGNYRWKCKQKVENLYNEIEGDLENDSHKVTLDKLKELSNAIQQLQNSRVGSREQLTTPWKRSGVHGLFVRDRNVEEVFEDKFNKRFLDYTGTIPYRRGKRIRIDEVLLDIGNLILDKDEEDYYYIGLELFIITDPIRGFRRN